MLYIDGQAKLSMVKGRDIFERIWICLGVEVLIVALAVGEEFKIIVGIFIL